MKRVLLQILMGAAFSVLACAGGRDSGDGGDPDRWSKGRGGAVQEALRQGRDPAWRPPLEDAATQCARYPALCRVPDYAEETLR